MPQLRYTEFTGTALADSFDGRGGSLYYGLQGNDTFTIAPHTVFATFMGGGGADTYVTAADSTMTVLETGNSPGDTIIAMGVGFNYATSYAATIDGRHLFFFDLASGDSALVLDWHNPVSRVESFVLGDGTYTYEFVSAVLPGAPHYLGNYSWAASGLAPGFSADDINEAISFYMANAARMETPDGQSQWSGTVGPDWSEGTPAGDRMLGLAGDDTLRGLQGHDVIYGNVGRDQLDGSSGNDTLYGGRDADLVFGASGNDVAYGNLGDDTVYGEDGDDVLYGGAGNDVLTGAGGTDRIFGNLGDDTMYGGAGADRFRCQTGGGSDVIFDFAVTSGDRIELAAGTGYSLRSVPNGTMGSTSTEIVFGDGSLVRLIGVPVASVTSDAILFV